MGLASIKTGLYISKVCVKAGFVPVGAQYVWNHKELIQASQDAAVTHLMGLFEPNDMKYDIHQDPAQDPSLAEMMEGASSTTATMIP